MLKLYKLRDYNFRLVLFLFLLSGLGVLLVNSADPTLTGVSCWEWSSGLFSW